MLFAREHELEIAVRGGAHSGPGLSSVDDGLVVDLRFMRDVEVDPATRRARVGGGATLGDKDAATLGARSGLDRRHRQPHRRRRDHPGRWHGLAPPARRASRWDALVSAEVVTAHWSRPAVAAEDEHADLFWALRGGGGNFGVVTAFE